MSETNSSTDSSIMDDNDLIDFRERAEIVDKYDKGTYNQEIDEWENPNFEVYKKTDRYGFMHENETRLNDTNEEKAREDELKREMKWLKMIRNWDKYKHSIKLRRRIFKGIPEKLRTMVWGNLLELERSRQPGVYEQLRLRARLVSKDLKQIDLDINRTYRNHLFFRRRYDMKQRALFHVLAAYAMYNTQVGYCQGMSQIAALLLMYFDEEDAFWALHTLMCDEIHAMHGFFVPGFPKLMRFQQHHERILKKMLPKLKKHLDRYEIYSTLYTTKWFFQCFLDRVPFTMALRLWDNFILDGDIVLSGAAYCILKMHQKTLLKMNFEQVMEFLQIRLEKNFGYTNDETIDALRACLAELRRSKVLEPAPPDKSEKPTKPFGEVLDTPLDDIRRAVSSVMSRKVRPSRPPSVSQSTPVTPQHRTPPAPTVGISPVVTIFVSQKGADDEDEGGDRQILPQPQHPQVPSPSGLSNDVTKFSVNDRSGIIRAPDQLPPSSTGLRHVPSFYDNVPTSPNPNTVTVLPNSDSYVTTSTTNYFYHDSRNLASRPEGEFVIKFGKDTMITNLSTNYGPIRRPGIQTGPDYVTNVEVDPEWRYSYASSTTSSSNVRFSPNSQYSATSTEREMSTTSLSPSKKPAKFPITPGDLWDSPSKRSVDTLI